MNNSATTYRCEILYLALPAIIFFLGFMPLATGVPLSLLTIAGVLASSWQRPSPFNWKIAAVAALGACFALFLMGFPYGPFTWDWIKHWAILNQMSTTSWPVVFSYDGEDHYLRYYLGAYIVPALAHKLLPALSVAFFFAVWMFAGSFLVLKMVAQSGNSLKQYVLAAVIFLALGGMDALVHLALAQAIGYPATPWLGLHHEDWTTLIAFPLEFSSTVTSFIWVPNQSIATFLAAGLLVLSLQGGSLPRSFLAYGLLSAWSPYGAIGLLPLVLAVAFKRRGELFQIPTLVAGAAGFATSLVTALYLSTEMPDNGACFTCFLHRPEELRIIVPFLIAELLPFALILRRRLVTELPCLVSLLTLTALPFLHGDAPDIVMRGSMGPLFVLMLYCVRGLLSEDASGWRRDLRIAAMLLCLPTAISEIWYARSGGSRYSEYPKEFALSPNHYKLTLATKTDYTIEEFFAMPDYYENFVRQYYTAKPPRLTGPYAAKQDVTGE